MYSRMSWQKPARIGVAIVGLASAAAVYFMMGERRVSQPPPPVQSRSPNATLEIIDCVLKNFPGTDKNFEVDCDRLIINSDGTKSLTGDPLVITVHKAGNRTFKVIGRQAKVSKDETQLEVIGDPVRLEDSDGFWLETDRATVNRLYSISHVEGAATFGKGRMTGSGVGFTYDDKREVLVIAQKVSVRTVDEKGKLVMQLASSSGMLDRLQHFLTLDTNVHVIRDEQIIDTNYGTARLAANNEVVTAIELYGNSRVTGGPSIETMGARDITLDYTDDGKVLEATKLIGGATVATKGKTGQSGQRFAGETIDVALAADGTLTSVVGRDNVRLELPAAADTPPRIITAQTLDGTGQAGKGLTEMTFTTDVYFEERPLRGKGPAAEKQGGMRTARSQRLVAALADDAVSAAAFSGDVTFEEDGLKACAANADYRPEKGALTLTGATKAGAPMAAEERVAIEGPTINVALDTRKMTANGGVTTFMNSPAAQRCRPARPRPREQQGANQVPRLLKSDAPMTVVAESLEYDSEKGYAEYLASSSVRATLRQEGTLLSAERLILDQTKGDLTATGKAVSKLLLDNETTDGRAHEIRYVDSLRQLTFLSDPKVRNDDASLISDSTVRAGNILITLHATENKPQSMKAARNVRLTEGTQTVTDGDSLDYTASGEQFVVRSDRVKPVRAVTRSGSTCRVSVGHSITFVKGKDDVTIDGKQIGDARSAPSPSTCTPAPR
jgi:lipopolysaccharide export system protein LptA/lipopolysaccharide export system protein LptC